MTLNSDASCTAVGLETDHRLALDTQVEAIQSAKKQQEPNRAKHDPVNLAPR
jgi:hypothetical protein